MYFFQENDNEIRKAYFQDKIGTLIQDKSKKGVKERNVFFFKQPIRRTLDH